MVARSRQPLVERVRRESLWELGAGSLLLGGGSLLLAWAGTPVMKLGVVASTLVGVLGVKSHRVWPFGTLWDDRGRVHLKVPALTPLVAQLERIKQDRLPLLGTGWILLETFSGLLGAVFPSSIRIGIAGMGHAIPVLAAWPTLQTATDWAYMLAITGIAGLSGTASILWLSCHLLVRQAIAPE